MESIGAYRQSEMLDVQLLDVFAQIETLLRLGREVQREALRVRGLPVPVTPSGRKAAAQAIRQRLDEMRAECEALVEVLSELHGTATTLDELLQTESDEAPR